MAVACSLRRVPKTEGKDIDRLIFEFLQQRMASETQSAQMKGRIPIRGDHILLTDQYLSNSSSGASEEILQGSLNAPFI